LRIARKRGIAIVGKTNLSEFAIRVSGSNDYFGTPINPVASDRVPGGSSSGSAVAVALDLADVALGTDTAGSVRVRRRGLKDDVWPYLDEGRLPDFSKVPRYSRTDGQRRGRTRKRDGAFAGRLRHSVRQGQGGETVSQKDPDWPAPGARYGSTIDEAIDARLAERGFQIVPLGIFEPRFLGIQNTVAVNYAGVPALALPIPLPGERFPVTSIQLIGPPKSEAALLNIGRLIETKS
jgi:amidase